MQVKCECGRLLKVPDSFVGKNARCPACKRVFKVPGTAPTKPAVPTKVTMQCSCGKRLSAPVSAAGKKVLCPACNTELTVPSPEPAKAAPQSPPEKERSPALDEKETKPEEEGYGVVGVSCPNCGASLGPGAQFCVACGTHLATGSHVEGANIEEAKKDKTLDRKMQLIIGGAVAGVIVLGAITFGLMFLRKGRPEAPPSKPVEASAPANPASPASAKKLPKLGPPPLKKGKDEGYVEMVAYAPGRVRAKMDTMAANQVVKAFEIDKDRLPKDISELEAAGYHLQELSTGLEYEYDPKTGEITIWRLKDRPSPAQE